MPSPFECARTIELAASPDRVWDAVATPEGNASWLFPNDMDPSQAQDNPNIVFEPPRRLTVRMEQGEWFNVVDFEIEPRGEKSGLRYCHRGVFMQDAPNQEEGIQQHTDFYLHTLSEYVEHFSPRHGTYVGDVPGGIQGPAASTAPDAFRRVKAALGLSDANVQGERVHLTPAGLEPIDGVLDYVTPNFLGIRTSDALLRFFGRNAFGAPIGIQLHLFGDSVDAERTRQAWQSWLNAVFA